MTRWAPARRGQTSRPWLRSTWLACLVLAAGCTSYRKPQIVVDEARIADASAEATQISIGLDIANPNQAPLELRTFRYEVSVDGHPVYAGKRSAEATLGGGSGKTFALPAVVPGRLDEGAAWSIRGSLLYVTPGALAEILLDSGVRRPRAVFAGSGRVGGP